MSAHGIYIALEPSLDGKEPTAFKAVVLSCMLLLKQNQLLTFRDLKHRLIVPELGVVSGGEI
jgi:hypothetical protein